MADTGNRLPDEGNSADLPLPQGDWLGRYSFFKFYFRFFLPGEQLAITGDGEILALPREGMIPGETVIDEKTLASASGDFVVLQNGTASYTMTREEAEEAELDAMVCDENCAQCVVPDCICQGCTRNDCEGCEDGSLKDPPDPEIPPYCNENCATCTDASCACSGCAKESCNGCPMIEERVAAVMEAVDADAQSENPGEEDEGDDDDEEDSEDGSLIDNIHARAIFGEIMDEPDAVQQWTVISPDDLPFGPYIVAATDEFLESDPDLDAAMDWLRERIATIVPWVKKGRLDMMSISLEPATPRGDNKLEFPQPGKPPLFVNLRDVLVIDAKDGVHVGL